MNALQIDYIEIFVPDRYEAARWYGRVLGLEIVPEFEGWAADPRGPLMISSDGGSTKVALFQGPPRDGSAHGGLHLLAFRTTADGFLDFLNRLAELRLRDHHDTVVTPGSIVDHDLAYSIYFCDGYGNRLELTTYEHREIRAARDPR